LYGCMNLYNCVKRLFYYPGPFWRIISFVGVLVMMVSVVIWGSYLLIRVAFGASRDWVSWALRAWTLFVCRVFAVRFEISGQENHDPNQPSIIVANHQSLFDIPACFYALSGHIRMVAKKELFRIPFFGDTLRKTDFVMVDRGNQNSGREVTRKMAELIRGGIHVWIAPEGGRTLDGKMLEFKRGSFVVALEHDIPLQPFVVVNGREVCPKGSLLPRPGILVRIKVLPRVYPSKVSKNNVDRLQAARELAAGLRSQMSREI